jgi:predicted RND superfamily exporter protein
MTYRRRAERLLALWARFVSRRPRLCLLFAIAVTGFLATGLTKLEIDSSSEGWLKTDDPARISYDRFREEFGYEDPLYLLVETEDPFARDFVERLHALHRELESELPFASKVTSILNARDVRGERDELIVEGLLDEWPVSDQALAAARERAFANPLYRGTLLSEDGRHTAIVVDLLAAPDLRSMTPVNRTLSGDEGELVSDTLGSILQRHEAAGLKIWASGRHPITSAIVQALERDMQMFTGISLAMIAILLLVLFRRVPAAIQAFSVITATLIGTFGAMGLLGFPITPAMQITPSFLVAIATAQSVHILALFYHDLHDSHSPAISMCEALSHSGPAVVLTSLTTAACLLSFAYADLAVIASFGLTSCLGVMISLAATLGLLPAVLVLWPVDERPDLHPAIESHAKLLAAIGDVATRNPRTIVAAWALALIVSAAFASQLRFDHEPTTWFAPDHLARQSVDRVNDVMKTGLSYEVLLDTGVAEGLYEPDILRLIEATGAVIHGRSHAGVQVGRPVSIVDIVKETHQALNENRADRFEIPDSRELVAQELLLFEMSGSKDMADFVDHEYRKARMTVPVPIIDGFAMRDHLEAVTREIHRVAGEHAEVVVTGQLALEARAGTALITSMGKSYLMALAMLVPLMILLAGNVRLGLITMLPNVIPIVMAMGLMAVLSIQLDMFTTLIASLAIGVAVDDTIHLLHSFKREYNESGDAPSAVRKTLSSTGRALLFTSVVLMGSFLTFTGAVMISVQSFGIVTAFAIGSAFLADVTLTPALIVITHPSKIPESSDVFTAGPTMVSRPVDTCAGGKAA